MDEKALRQGRALVNEIMRLETLAEHWEMQDEPLQPNCFGADSSKHDVDLAAWEAYRRTSIAKVLAAMEEARVRLRAL